MILNYIPNFIRSNENMKSGEKITAEKWNAVHNLLVTQGDKNSETIKDIVDFLNGLTLSPMEIKPDIPGVYDDEFDGETLDPKWSWVNSVDGGLPFPTSAWTPEEIAEYCNLDGTHPHAALGTQLVEQYAAQYGFAVHIAESGPTAQSYIMVTDELIGFQGYAPTLYVDPTYTDVCKMVALSTNSETGVVTAGTLADVSSTIMDNYGVSSAVGGFKLLNTSGLLILKEHGGSTGIFYGTVGTEAVPFRNATVRNSRLILETKIKTRDYCDYNITFLTQSLDSPVFPLNVTASLEARIDLRGDPACIGTALRNRVTGEYLVFGIEIDFFPDYHTFVVKGTGDSCGIDENALRLPGHTWGIDFPNTIKIFPRLQLTDSGVDLYMDLFGEVFKCDSFTYEEIFTAFTEADKENFDVGIAVLQNGSGMSSNPWYSCQYIGIDWFRVEEATPTYVVPQGAL